MRPTTSKNPEFAERSVSTMASDPFDADVPEQNVDDILKLADLGYKQELKRTFSTLQVFGISFSIMGLLPSIGKFFVFFSHQYHNTVLTY